MVFFSNKQAADADKRIKELETKYSALLEQLKVSNVIVDLTLSQGTQTTGTLGTSTTTYLTQITQNLFSGNDLKNLVDVQVYHPNGTLQPNRMMTFGYQLQFYPQDDTKQGILITGIPTGTYTDNYYKQLKVRLIFNSAVYQ